MICLPCNALLYFLDVRIPYDYEESNSENDYEDRNSENDYEDSNDEDVRDYGDFEEFVKSYDELEHDKKELDDDEEDLEDGNYTTFYVIINIIIIKSRVLYKIQKSHSTFQFKFPLHILYSHFRRSR